MNTKRAPQQQAIERQAQQTVAKTKAELRARERGNFWAVQVHLAMAIQGEMARTIAARRIDGEPATGDDLLKLMHAMEMCGAIMAEAEERRGESDAGGDS